MRAGDLVFVSGAGPQTADGSFITGKVGADVDIETAQEAAKLCASAAWPRSRRKSATSTA